MKSDFSLGDLKNLKKKFFKKSRFRIFLILKLPMRPELVFFIPFSLLGTQNCFIFGKKFNFEILFYRKYLNLKKNHTKSEQTSRVHTKFQSSITPRKN